MTYPLLFQHKRLFVATRCTALCYSIGAMAALMPVYFMNGEEFSIGIRQDMRNIRFQEGKTVYLDLKGTAVKLCRRTCEDISCLSMWDDSQWVPRRCVRSSHLDKGTPGFLRTPPREVVK